MKNKEIEKIMWGIGIDSWNRFQVFLDLAPKLSGESYWYALRIAYSDSDNLFRYKDSIKRAFSVKEAGVEDVMTEEELQILDSIPEELTIYRGMTLNEKESEEYGISWTLDKKTAEFFAYTYDRNLATYKMEKTVESKLIHKKEIVMLLNERKELEVIWLDGFSDHLKRK